MDTIISMIMTPLMAIEILTAEYLSARHFEKRDYFHLRFFGGALVCIILTIWIEVMYFLVTGNQFIYGEPAALDGILFKIFYYVIIFGMTIGVIALSYHQSIIVILVCCSVGYAIQYCASSFSLLLNMFTESLESPYGYIADCIIWLVTRGCIYTLFGFVLKKKRFEEENFKENNRNKVILCFLVIIVFICLSRLLYDDQNRSDFAKIAEPIYAMLCSALIIAIELSMAKNDVISQELIDTKLLLRQEREQYLMSKENIEIINEKCHDLKHQISYLRQDRSDKSIEEIEKAVMIYDSTVKTGSNVLDILLTEKKLQCGSKDIKLTTVVNGKLLSFMEEMELYSLFGNALSNAIESVSAIPQKDSRHIDLKVREVGDMISIHMENPYIGEIVFHDGMPETAKDKIWHGYGMKSMNRIVSTYGGVMTVTAQDGIFRLDILMPKGEDRNNLSL